MRLVLIFLLTLTIARCQVKNGRDAAEKEIPYQALLRVTRARWTALNEKEVINERDEHATCGGSLLNSKWVLTAAHCIRGQTAGRYFVETEEFEVMVGSRDTRDGEDATNQQTTTSDTFISHEGYKYGRPDAGMFDIALLLLNERVFYSDWVRPAVLSQPVNDPETNWNCRVSGWGVFRRTHDGKRLVDLMPNVLQVADEMHVIQNYQTQFSYATLCKMDELCQSSFEGDSGGPVACRQSEKHEFGNVVHGIVSGGSKNFLRAGTMKDSCMVVKPSIFVSWIEDRMRSKTPNMNIEQQGSDASSGEAPHHVSILGKYRNRKDLIAICQGAVISKRWILTAASCVDENPLPRTRGHQRAQAAPKNLTYVVVKAGVNRVRAANDEKTLQEQKSTKWYQHDSYDRDDKYDKHNVALILLPKDIRTDGIYGEYVKAIDLFRQGRPSLCYVFGWEENYEAESNSYDSPLQKRGVKIIDGKNCMSPMLKPKAIQKFLDYQICTRQEFSRPTISVGAGTTLVCKDPVDRVFKVFGVASFAGYWERVGGGAGPKVFTRIQPNLDWIMNKQKDIVS